MAAHTFFSFCVQPLLHSASPVAGNGGRRSRRGRPRGIFRPSPVISTPGQEHASHSLSNDFDFQEGLKNVQAFLHQRHKSSREMMITVDHLKRLCIDHYFQHEIDNVVDACVDLLHSDDLLDATLSFRLMREARYHVSADEVLGRFVDDSGNFKLAHSKDIKGLLSLHDMSHLNMGEASLYKAKELSSKHLKTAIKYLEPNLARYVRQSLDHPYHVSLMQYKARHHLSYLQSLPTRNIAIEELALAEFQLNKLLHQREMHEVKRWWLGLGLTQEIPAARDQVLKWYIWTMTVLHGQSFSRIRIEITKIISLVYIVDDIFDLVATLEELSLFTEAIKMWNLSAADSLPSYMRSCYKALYTITNDIADMAEKEHGSNPTDHLKKAWAMLFDGFMVEAKWLSTNHVPARKDYLENGVVTSGGPLVLLHVFFMLGHDVTKDAAMLTDHIPPVFSCPSKMLRLWDDMGSAKDEAQNGIDGSYKELYLKENPDCAPSDAEKHMFGLIEGAWEELNTECFSKGQRSFLPSFVRASLNFARMVHVMYAYDKEQRLPVLEDYAKMLLF